MADARSLDAEVIVVGAGPAGLSAATALRRGGAGRVVVLDREPEPGGIPRHCGHPPYGLREFGRVMTGPAYARRVVAEARAAGVDIRCATSVVSVETGGRLTVTSDAGVETLAARMILLSTGVRERPRAARLLGGTKPGGVMSTGTLQGLVYLEGRTPFERPVVLGTELVAFSALLTCRHAGIRPVAMIEPGPATVSRWPSGWLPRLMGVPLRLDTRLTRIEGRDAVEAVVVEGPGGTERIATDGVIVSGEFLPEATLVRSSHLAFDRRSGGPRVDQWGRTSDPVVFAAGNVLRPVETAGWSWREGRAIARAMLRALDGGLPDPAGLRDIEIAGDVLRFVVPQRVGPGTVAPALPQLQMRVREAVRGRLVLTDAAGEVVSRAGIGARPERRVRMPLPALEGAADGPLTLRLERTVQSSRAERVR